ncbi:MAG: type II secretion system protein, partial [Planctomycetota bacterium]
SKMSARAGFTLVELLVVIAIISLLAGLLVPTVGIAQKKARKTACLSNLKEIGKLCQIYAQDHRDRFPFDKSKKNPLAYESFQVLADSMTDVPPRIFCSPAHRDDPAVMSEDKKYTLDENSCSYAYIAQPQMIGDDGSQALAANDSIRDSKDSTPEGHENGVNVVFMNFSAEFVERPDLPEGRSLPKGLIGNSASE